MKYQALKQLKTKNKLLGVFKTLQEAHNFIRDTGATFMEFSYIGGFPVNVDTIKKRVFSIQGLADIGVVCSIPDAEKGKVLFSDHLPLQP